MPDFSEVLAYLTENQILLVLAAFILAFLGYAVVKRLLKLALFGLVFLGIYAGLVYYFARRGKVGEPMDGLHRRHETRISTEGFFGRVGGPPGRVTAGAAPPGRVVGGPQSSQSTPSRMGCLLRP